MLNIALIVYHKNADKIYPAEWISKFKESIINQTYKNFKIYEMEYSGGTFRIFENSMYESRELPTFIHAMNYLIEQALLGGADAIANSNCDDYFDPQRLELQLPYIESGFDIVSSNFSLIDGEDKIFKYHHFDLLDIKQELNIDHNIIGHPSVVYSRRFLENNKYIPEECPIEDMNLWKRTIDNYKFKIVPQSLLYHRIHNQSVCQSNNR